MQLELIIIQLFSEVEDEVKISARGWPDRGRRDRACSTLPRPVYCAFKARLYTRGIGRERALMLWSSQL